MGTRLQPLSFDLVCSSKIVFYSFGFASQAEIIRDVDEFYEEIVQTEEIFSYTIMSAEIV